MIIIIIIKYNVRVPVGLRLGCRIGEPHECVCGSPVDAMGSHALSCRHGSGRLARHHSVNDLVHRALTRANIPAIKEPKGQLKKNGKRPDGYTLIPWHAGRNLTWDVSINNTVAASYLPLSSTAAGGAAEMASEKKVEKYSELSTTSCFCSIIMETFGPINDLGLALLTELGRRMTDCTGDARETKHLLQRISVTIQRCNSILFRSSFAAAS